MQYPLISEYREAIMSAEDNFDKLSSLRPVLDSYGDPIMSSGNFAVVFKMKDIDTDKLYAVKCFIKDQEGRNESYAMIADELKNVSSPYIVPIRFLERELFVESLQSDESEFPVLVMDWVEGNTLDAYLRENLEKKYSLQLLTYRFCQMSAWLMEQPFAHGDLKPDNILVREDGSLVLVDYDGFYVPAMKGQEARELGSPDFRHPQRTLQDFDEHIDDFSIATIALSLKAISLDSQLYNTHAASDRLLLSSADYHDIGNSATMQKIVQLASDTELATIVGAFYIALAQRQFDSVKFERLVPKTPPLVTIVIQGNGEIITKKDVNAQLLENTFDDIWLQLSGNAKKSEVLVHVQIAEGVQCIEDRAFEGINNIFEVSIPKSMRRLGSYAFSGCTGLAEINIPDSVTKIGWSTFSGCCSLTDIIIPNSVTKIECSAFKGCTGLTEINIPNLVSYIGELAFEGCTNLTDIIIPNSVTKIECSAFKGCTGLTEINIPNSVSYIGESAFEGCTSLTEINIPDSVIKIGWSAFKGCTGLTEINIPNSVSYIGESAFEGCTSLTEINIPDSVTNIGWSTFSGCCSLTDINIPDSVTNIGSSAFRGCCSLIDINIPNSVTKIEAFAFNGCTGFTEINISNSVSYIGESAFEGCTNLTEIIIPNDITEIGAFAFRNSPIQNLIPQRIQQKIKEMEDNYLPF